MLLTKYISFLKKTKNEKQKQCKIGDKLFQQEAISFQKLESLQNYIIRYKNSIYETFTEFTEFYNPEFS